MLTSNVAKNLFSIAASMGKSKSKWRMQWSFSLSNDDQYTFKWEYEKNRVKVVQVVLIMFWFDYFFNRLLQKSQQGERQTAAPQSSCPIFWKGKIRGHCVWQLEFSNYGHATRNEKENCQSHNRPESWVFLPKELPTQLWKCRCHAIAKLSLSSLHCIPQRQLQY